MVQAQMLAPRRLIDDEICLEPGFKIPYGEIYNLTEVEVGTLMAYIEPYLAHVFIQRSSTSSAALIVFLM